MDIIEFEDQCLIPPLKLSLQGLTIMEYPCMVWRNIEEELNLSVRQNKMDIKSWSQDSKIKVLTKKN